MQYNKEEILSSIKKAETGQVILSCPTASDARRLSYTIRRLVNETKSFIRISVTQSNVILSPRPKIVNFTIKEIS